MIWSPATIALQNFLVIWSPATIVLPSLIWSFGPLPPLSSLTIWSSGILTPLSSPTNPPFREAPQPHHGKKENIYPANLGRKEQTGELRLNTVVKTCKDDSRKRPTSRIENKKLPMSFFCLFKTRISFLKNN